MERRGFTLPLLIGGATTSRQHTAVKIAPEYSGADGARARRVARGRRRVEPARARAAATRSTSANRDDAGGAPRAATRPRSEKPLLPYEQARANRLKTRLGRARHRRRRRSSAAAYLDDVPLEELVQFIDWTFFFSAWELKGRFPAILEHPQYGAAARELYEQRAGAARRASSTSKLLTRARRLRLLAGEQPTATTSSSTRTTTARERAGAASTCCGSRRSIAGRPAEPVAGRLRRAARERRARLHRRVRRDRRASAPTSSCKRFEQRARRLQRDHGEGAGRSAGRGVRRVLCTRRRRDDWGYGAGEQLAADDLIAEKYRGIRPALRLSGVPGSHREVRSCSICCDADRQGITLTESFAMTPRRERSAGSTSRTRRRSTSTSAASAAIRLEAYAQRKGMSIEEAERWLAPNLAYDPRRAGLKC